MKFFVDNVKLEQCQHGKRIRSEVHREIVRRLRLAYFYRYSNVRTQYLQISGGIQALKALYYK